MKYLPNNLKKFELYLEDNNLKENLIYWFPKGMK